MKLIEAIRSIRPAGSTSWTLPECPVLEWRELRGPVEGAPPAVAGVPGVRAAMAMDPLLQALHPWHRLVHHVPQEPQPALGTQHPVDLADRRRPVEPVEGLRDGHRVDRGVAEGDRLGGPGEHRDAGEGVDEPVAHLVDRLNRHDVGAARLERAGELAGARREVQHAPPRADAEHGAEVVDRVVRVVRPCALIAVGPGEPRRRALEVLRHQKGASRGRKASR